MSRLLPGSRQEPALNSCKRGSCPGGREAHSCRGAADPATLGPSPGERCLRDGPGTGSPPGWDGVLHGQTQHCSQKGRGDRTPHSHGGWKSDGSLTGQSISRCQLRTVPHIALPMAGTVLEEEIPIPAHSGTRSGAVSMWLHAIPSSLLPHMTQQHRCPHTGAPTMGAVLWVPGMPQYSPHDAAAGPWGRGSPACIRHHWHPQGRALPLPPSPSMAGRSQHVATGYVDTWPLPGTTSGGGSGVAGAHPSLAASTQAENIFHSPNRQHPLERPEDRVSGGTGVLGLAHQYLGCW